MSHEGQGKHAIMGTAEATAGQMLAYLRKVNPDAPDLTELYLDIGERYGIRGDMAFAQAIKETGYWRFGGSVSASQNNYAGIGAVGSTVQGASFPTREEGVEAHIQHLYGYATDAPLPKGTVIVDPRFELLELAGLRGAAPYWEDLNGKWAVPGNNYGQEIVRIWEAVLDMPVENDDVREEEPASPSDSNSGGGGASLITGPNWKQEAMSWLLQEGLINREHDPDAAVTWAQLGAVLARFDRRS